MYIMYIMYTTRTMHTMIRLVATIVIISVVLFVVHLFNRVEAMTNSINYEKPIQQLWENVSKYLIKNMPTYIIENEYTKITGEKKENDNAKKNSQLAGIVNNAFQEETSARLPWDTFAECDQKFGSIWDTDNWNNSMVVSANPKIIIY